MLEGRAGESREIALRAQVSCRERVLRGYVSHLSLEAARLRTADLLYPGDRVTLRLSVPGAHGRLELETHVVSLHAAEYQGQPGGATLAIVYRSDAERARVSAMLDEGVDPAISAHVLAVDGQRLARDVFVHSVERWVRETGDDLRVTAVAGAADAREVLEREPVDLVVVDRALPDADGAELVARLRDDRRFDRVAIVGVSAGSDDDDHGAMIGAGADLFLYKPLRARVLFDTLARAHALGGSS